MTVPTPKRIRVAYEATKAALAVVTTALLAVLLLLVLVNQSKLVQLAQDNHASGQLLVDCTTPHHKCYEDEAARTAAAVGSIKHIINVSAFCARTLPGSATEAQLEDCVTKTLAQGAH